MAGAVVVAGVWIALSVYFGLKEIADAIRSLNENQNR